MTTITATVRGGRLEVSEPINLPDGTELRIPLPDGPLSPEEVARILAAMDRMQPFDLTDAERAAMETARKRSE